VGENIYWLYIKGLITRTHRELKKLNSSKINEPIKKWATELNRTFSEKEIQIAKKHMKKCSPSLDIKEMQIKTTVRFHLTPVRIAIIKNTTKQQMLVRLGGKRNPYALVVGMKALWKKIWRLLKKLNTDLPYDPAIPLLGIYLKECDSSYSKAPTQPCLLQHYSQ
jgi:hypothetical protein